MSLQSNSDGLKMLEEQITCKICLSLFTNPKSLPCFHSFCLRCIEGMSKEVVNGSYYLCCPACRSSCPVPDKGLATLPSSFVINNLMEVHDLMKKATGDQDSAAYCNNCEKTNADRYCKQCAKFFCPQCLQLHDNWRPNDGHQTINLQEVASTAHQLLRNKPEEVINCPDHKESLKVFCETCDEAICHLCTVRKHKDHDYDVVNDVYKKYRDAINKSGLQPLNQEIERLSKAKMILVSRKYEITQQAEKANSDINQIISQLKNQFDETGRKLKGEVCYALTKKVDVLESQIKEIDAISSQTTEYRDIVDRCVKLGTPHQVLSNKVHMMQRSKTVVNNIRFKTFEPLEIADIELKTRNNSNTLYKNIGSVKHSSVSSTLVVKRLQNEIPSTGKKSTISISLSFPNGLPARVPSSIIKCRLSLPSDQSQYIKCSVQELTQSGQYDVLFTPVTRGRHQLHVVIQDGELQGSPMGVAITIPSDAITEPIDVVTGLKEPMGIAVGDNGLMVISEEQSHCVTILDDKGNKVKSFSFRGNEKSRLMNPRGVIITPKGTLLVVDSANNCIQEFTIEGELISSVGSRGTGQLQFNDPIGIAINKSNGKVFIVDQGNHRIQVLNPKLTFSHSWGGKGSREGQFSHPHDLAIDDRGNVYVTDGDNYRIQKFTCEGQFKYAVKFQNSASPDTPPRPSGITIDRSNNIIYANNINDNSIIVLTTDLKFTGSIRKKNSKQHNLSHFEGIFYDSQSGYLYVICSKSNVIKIF